MRAAFVILAAAVCAVSAKKKSCTTSSHHHNHSTTTVQTPAPTAAPGSGGGEKGEYSLAEDWVGDKFYDAFDFFTKSDPTHGRVNYVSEETAKAHNLTYASSNGFIMRADSKTKLKANDKGRMSVRITSKKSFTTHAAVFDLRHMPEGAGTWPAYWMNGANWPNGGEWDIVEGVNDGDSNLSSLHTSPGCTQGKSSARLMKGDVTNAECNAHANSNTGCGVATDSPRSFGPKFNSAGGGWYATERTEDRLSVWFWSRADSQVPEDVRNNTGSVSPSQWGKPTAVFTSGKSCNIKEKFSENKFIINLTLCGDWAGNTFPGGKAKCEQHVNENPSAYKNAYWDIARLNIYEP